jgi:hypothetical protein
MEKAANDKSRLLFLFVILRFLALLKITDDNEFLWKTKFFGHLEPKMLNYPELITLNVTKHYAHTR